MKLIELLSIPVGFAIVRSLTKRIEKEPITPLEPVIPTTGPAGPSVEDFKLIPESFTEGQSQGSGLTFSPITTETLDSFDPTRKAEVRPYDPGALVAQPIAQGKIKKFGTGVSLADLFARAK
jgi:hypothetical protein